MLPDFRVKTLTEFRTDFCKEVHWVERHGAHLWLTRHGRKIAAVIPKHHMQVLEAALGKPLNEHRMTMDEHWRELQRAEAARKQLMAEGKWL